MGRNKKKHWGGKTNQLRIIAGKWRSRLLSFDDALGLRPTTDRMRETLFNWLQPSLYQANCLDLFAGSGALGFEALSRGAGALVMIEKDKKITKTLLQNKEKLQANQCEIICADALHYLSLTSSANHHCAFDIILLDPPFYNHILPDIIEQLVNNHWLTNTSLIYIEQESSINKEEWNHQMHDYGWHLKKEKTVGQVWSALYQVDINNES